MEPGAGAKSRRLVKLSEQVAKYKQDRGLPGSSRWAIEVHRQVMAQVCPVWFHHLKPEDRQRLLENMSQERNGRAWKPHSPIANPEES